jgi:Beta-propeller repeat/Alpha/beta hydrolase of unknown function (DUF900)
VSKLNASGSALLYSTYLGGSSGDEGQGIAVDSSGDAYVTGYSNSTNFPTQSPLQSTFAGNLDVFVSKLNASGSALLYSTYLGGSGNDEGQGIAVDSSGDAYVTGYSNSTNFPTQNPLQSALDGGGDAFVTKLNASGSALLYSTYLGGSGNDGGQGIAVDSSGDAYVTGSTTSTNFPTQNPLQTTSGGSNSNGDAFVSKLNASGSALLYSTYLGGSDYDIGTGIAVDSSGHAYVTGRTDSADFPTQSPLQNTVGGNFDVFVSKLNVSGSALLYSTYLGGRSDDVGQGITVDSSGDAYVTGYTDSTDFPTQSPLQSTVGGLDNVFVTVISATSSPCVSSMLGSSQCVVPNSAGRVAILVPGIVNKWLDAVSGQACDLVTEVCDTYKHVDATFQTGGGAFASALNNPGASNNLAITQANEVPYSYGGVNAATFTLTQNHQSVNTSAMILQQLVTQLEEVPGVQHIDIIGHSLGGVVTGYAMNSLGLRNDSHVEYAIAVDSPLRGLSLALFAHVFGLKNNEPVMTDLQPNSTVASAINPEQTDPKFFALTNWDDDVVPASTAYVGPANAADPNHFWIDHLEGNVLDAHGKVLTTAEGAGEIASILRNGQFGTPSSKASDFFTQWACLTGTGLCINRIVFSIFSPANLMVTDPRGRRVGYDPTTGTVMNEIPGATYTGAGSEPQLISVPDDAQGGYQEMLTGTGTGSYTNVEQQALAPTLQDATVAGSTSQGQQSTIGLDVSSATPPVLGMNPVTTAI